MADYKSIVPKAQGGDPKALEELYSSTSRAVYFTCRSLLKNEQDAEDLMQNTYITAFKKLKTLDQPEKFEPWIKRMAANLCKDFLCKKGAHPSEPLDEESFDDVGENFLPDEYVIKAEKREIVMNIMRENLSDVLYQTVIMFYFDEMSVAEIAEEMNCPEGTVKYRLNAARAKIKKGVLDYEKKSGDKLYAFIGLPFLARLLSKEAEAASVPALDIMSVITQNSPYVPDSTAVDPNFTANTAARIGGKMLGTLKAKIIAGACAAAIVGGGVTAGVIIANNAKRNADNPNRPAYSSTSKPGGSNSGSGGGAGIDYSQSRFWFARQTWDEPPRRTFEGGVLADNRDIHDVDLHKIDNISAPFSAYKVLDESKDYVSDTFEDCFKSEYMLEPGDGVGIDTQYYESGTPAPPYDGLGRINVFNFDSEPRTVGYCLEHRWWQNYEWHQYPPDETRALGLDHELQETGPAPKEYAMLDAIKAKFGTPHYIRYGSIHEDDKGLDPKTQLYKEVEREFDTSYEGLVAAYYDMVYDYGDILMIITVREQIVGSNNINDVRCVEFWTRECWEHRRDIKANDGGENDNEQLFSPYEGEISPEPEPVSVVPSTEGNSPFWFARQVWNEAPRKTFEGGILADNRKTLDLRQIDSISAPYFSSILYSTDKTTDKFSDVWYNPREVDTYDIIEVETRVADDTYDGLGMIQIFNFDNIPHPIEDCLENGWWKTSPAVSGAFLYETTSLGLDNSLSRNNDDYVYEEDLVSAIIEKFGTPHYICYPWRYNGSENPDRRAAMNEDMESILNPVAGAEIHFIQYQFVYELENDVVMTVTISENRNNNDRITLNVDYVEFWSGACWENRNTVMNMDRTLDDPWDELELFTVYEP